MQNPKKLCTWCLHVVRESLSYRRGLWCINFSDAHMNAYQPLAAHGRAQLKNTPYREIKSEIKLSASQLFFMLTLARALRAIVVLLYHAAYNM